MDKRPPQNGWFFIQFVIFNSTLVYIIVCNQKRGVWRIQRDFKKDDTIELLKLIKLTWY